MTAPEVASALHRKEEALWLFQRLAPECAVDNLAFAIRTSAVIDPDRLAGVLRDLVRDHPALRTIFPAHDGVPARHVLDADTLILPIEVRHTEDAELDGVLTGLARQPFDLTGEPPMRVGLLALSGGGTVLCLVVHHIAFDARSAGIVASELAARYAGQPAPPAPVPTPPAPAQSAASLDYWRRELAGVDPRTQPLHRARPEPASPTFAGARLERDLGAPGRAALDKLRSRLRVTDTMLLLTAYLLVLARHGAGPDLLVAVPVDGRGRDGARAVGFHVSTVPLRLNVAPERTFRQLATEVRERLLAGMAHADVSFESLLGELGLEQMSWRAPLFRHMFSLLPPATMVALDPLPDAEWVPVDPGLSRYDVQLTVVPWPGRVVLQAVYGTEIHDAATVTALLERLELLLTAAAAQPDSPVGELDLWHPDERALVESVHRAASEYPPDRLVAHLIGERIAGTPEAPALIASGAADRDHGWLGARTEFLRRHLAAAGVGDGDVVALALPRGGDLAAAVLATWSLGAAYLPVDPHQPPARLRIQLDTAQARAVLVAAGGLPDGAAGCPVLALDALGEPPGARVPLPAALASVTGDQLAYVIFTSGSTGEPKAVEITHANLANLIGFFARHLAVTPRDRVLWLTSFGFDISALELFLPLCHGGGAIVAPDAAQVQPDVLLDLVTRHDAAIVQTTPTIWRLVAAGLDRELAGRVVLCGGEPLSAALAQRLLRGGCRLFNVYGPTETTIWSTVAEIGPQETDPVGVGGPIARTTLRVEDAQGRPVPPGVVGELCIGGTGVARGYRGRPDLTAERFRDDPVFGRHYRTGDRATRRADGTIELLGRVDRQVKLRGRRIELGEIEAALERHPAIAAAAVVVAGDAQSDGRLVGYLQPVTAGAAPALAAEVSRFAATLLPPYLVPATLVVLDRLPRNASGKLDHRALPPVPAGDTATAPEQSSSDDPLVRLLLELWAQLLDRDDLHAHSNFFASGGHSLLAAVLTARIQERTGREVSLQDVFTAPTPDELAVLVRGTGPTPQALSQEGT
jgi:amino acid adenylation domain-containing protein